MLHEFIQTFLLVFVAELGDKTQVMLMTLAAKYSIIQVLLGIFIGVTLNHGLAILIGEYIANIVNVDFLQIFAGIIFVIFGVLGLSEDDEEEKREKIFKGGAVFTVATTFFLGELGDKTQLTAMTLSMEAKYHAIVLLGSVTAMIVVGLIGIIVGSTLTKHIPPYIIKIVSGVMFMLFGISKLFDVCSFFTLGSYASIYRVILMMALFVISSMKIVKILKST